MPSIRQISVVKYHTFSSPFCPFTNSLAFGNSSMSRFLAMRRQVTQQITYALSKQHDSGCVESVLPTLFITITQITLQLGKIIVYLLFLQVQPNRRFLCCSHNVCYLACFFLDVTDPSHFLFATFSFCKRNCKRNCKQIICVFFCISRC